MYLTRNQAGVYSASGVRIPPSPPDANKKAPSRGLFICIRRGVAWFEHLGSTTRAAGGARRKALRHKPRQRLARRSSPEGEAPQEPSESPPTRRQLSRRSPFVRPTERVARGAKRLITKRDSGLHGEAA